MDFFYSLVASLPSWLVSILTLLVFCVQIYLIVDSVRNSRGFFWIWILFVLPVIGSLIYWFTYKWDGSGLEHFFFRRGRDARHLEVLETAESRIGNAANHEELGDELWRQGKFQRAEECYRTALAKDPKLRDARSRLGYCLLEQNRPQEAWPLSESVIKEDAAYDHEHLLWQAARCMRKLGDFAKAREFYEQYTARHSYAEPQVELAEVCAELGDHAEARRLCEEVIAEVKLSAGYVRRKEGSFAGRAKRLLKLLPR